MTASSISRAQLQVAQVLWSQYVRERALDYPEARDTDSKKTARLRWAGNLLGREVISFKDLSRSEAHRLINGLKKSLGLSTRMAKQARAEDAGTQGRRRSARHDVLASQADLDRIKDALGRLGWSEERLAKWLVAPSSPLKSATGRIVTQADANRVWWALKRMLRSAGAWEKGAASKSFDATGSGLPHSPPG